MITIIIAIIIIIIIIVIVIVFVVAKIGLEWGGGGGGYFHEYFQEQDPRLVKQKAELKLDSVKNSLQWFIYFLKGFLHWVLGMKLISKGLKD